MVEQGESSEEDICGREGRQKTARYLDGMEESFQPENTITVTEMLKAWTIGGQKNLSMENKLGTLEEGKLADIVVFDRNLLKVSAHEAKEASVLMTIMDGKI